MKVFLKFLFAFIIIYWLLTSGKLDFSMVQKAFSEGYLWAIAIFLILVQATLGAVRWRILLRVRIKKELPMKDMLRLNWIGLFFNSFLPGAVTGDFIKLVYARDLDREVSKTFLVMSVLMDRVIGLMGLLCILGIFSSIYYAEITAISPQLTYLIHFNFLLFAGAIVFIIMLFVPKRIQQIVLDLVIKIPLLGGRIEKTLSQVWAFGEDKKIIVKTLAISMTCQFLGFLAFWVISHPFYGKAIPLPFIMTFIPIGFMATAIPITPAGLGIGHAIFDKLFHFAGVDGGASFFNLFFVCMVMVNLLGIFPYLLSGKRHKLSEAHQFDDVNA